MKEIRKKIKYIFQKIFDFLLTIFLLKIRLISLILSAKCRNRVGKWIGNFGYFLAAKRRKIAINNLEIAFPEKKAEEIEKIAKGSFQNLGITFFELFAMSSLSEKKLQKMIDFDGGIELINRVNSRRKGMIFLSGHFGNWEIIAYSVGVFTKIPITIIVKPQANIFIDKFLNKFRTASGNEIVSMYKAARTIIDVITKGETIALLADQAATKDKDLFIDFFGRQASTHKVVGELALRYKIPIIMGFAVRQKDGKYKAEIFELEHNDLENSIENVRKLTERHVKLLENIIKKYPEQWAWMHKRWKHFIPK
jgi:KDO2-lipid IV(A) lauroyltransferase